jgi:hypothetical protein
MNASGAGGKKSWEFLISSPITAVSCIPPSEFAEKMAPYTERGDRESAGSVVETLIVCAKDTPEVPTEKMEPA